MTHTSRSIRAALVLMIGFAAPEARAQDADAQPDLDASVQAFLDAHRGQWHDANVPTADGQLLYDLVLGNGYTKALEIGTSTGHSAIWIAWALSKTGGKLITIEIDEGRYREAMENFEAAGLTDYIDARLADAHDLDRLQPCRDLEPTRVGTATSRATKAGDNVVTEAKVGPKSPRWNRFLNCSAVTFVVISERWVRIVVIGERAEYMLASRVNGFG